MKKKSIILPIISALLVVLTILLLLPVINVSRYAYPWSDDFSYSADARMVFVETRSIIKTVAKAAIVSAKTYFEWQGTYTSCFLMALQPAVWGTRAYHLTGAIMLGTLLMSYLLLSDIVLRKILKFSFSAALSVGLLIYILSIEKIRGIAEAFTWYNSAVHYTFNHAWFWILIAFYALYLKKCENKLFFKCGQMGSAVILSVLALLVAGGNNITVLGGMLFLVIILIILFVYQKFLDKTVIGKKKCNTFINAIPVTISFLLGSLINFLAPGNKERLSIIENKGGNSAVLTILHSFYVGLVEVKTRFTMEVLAVLIIIGIIAWYYFSVKKCLDDISFEFPLPGIIVLASYCLLSALNTPILFAGNETAAFEYLFLQMFNTYRVENIIYMEMVLFLIVDEIYFLGWFYKKVMRKPLHAGLVVTSVIVAVIILIFSIVSNIHNQNGTYLTKAAVDNLSSGTAQYYGYQMAENTNRLKTDDSDVYVMPIGVDPACLYPYEAEDWIFGTRLFYNKNSVNYESEPYQFAR